MTESTVKPGKINFSKIGQLIDPSIYEATLDGYKFKQTEAGADMWTLIYKIIEDEKWANKKVFRNFMSEGDAAYYFIEALIAMGIDPDELMADEDQDVEVYLKQAIGARVRLHIGIRSYVDKKSGDTKEVNDVSKVEAI